jgi:hypothetical protein
MEGWVLEAVPTRRNHSRVDLLGFGSRTERGGEMVTRIIYVCTCPLIKRKRVIIKEVCTCYVGLMKQIEGS